MITTIKTLVLVAALIFAAVLVFVVAFMAAVVVSTFVRISIAKKNTKKVLSRVRQIGEENGKND